MIRRPWSSRYPAPAAPVRGGLRVEPLEDRSVPAARAVDALAGGPPPATAGTFEPDQILVRFAPQTAATAVPGTAVGPAVGLVPGLHRVQLGAGVSVEQAVNAYRNRPGVLYAEPDYVITAQLTPTDTLFPQQWGMQKINAPAAWDVTTGANGPLVAVVDSGIDYTHPELAGNIWTNPGEIAGNGRDDDGNGFVDDVRGYDFINGDSNPMDDNAHGTHVAGIIGAAGNNGAGVAGVGWGLKLMPVKIIRSDGRGSVSAAVSGINYAVANGAVISNHSWGVTAYSQSLADAVEAARLKGHILVAAAGNGGLDQVGDNNDASAFYPANLPHDNLVAVAATTQTDGLTYFSNYGATTVDLGAPGQAVWSTIPVNLDTQDGSRDGYASYSGTSMATPHVTGVLALVRGQNPGWTYTQVINQVLGTVDPVPALSGKTVTGGRLNAFDAVRLDLAPWVTAATPAGTVRGPVTTATVTFSEPVRVDSFQVDPSTESDVQLTGPNNTDVLVTTVTPLDAVNGFATQFRLGGFTLNDFGKYTLTVGPNVTDSVGNPMDQNRNKAPGEPGDAFTASFSIADGYTSTDVPAPIKDLSILMSYLDVDESATIADLNVKLNVSHKNVGDLYIYLQSPAGTRVVLFNRRGGSGDDLVDTVFDDEAAKAIRTGKAPFTGSFKPEKPLSAFDNQNVRGRWTLYVEDHGWNGIGGTLTGWSLAVTPKSAGGTGGAGIASFDGAEPAVTPHGAAVDVVLPARPAAVRPADELPLPPRSAPGADAGARFAVAPSLSGGGLFDDESPFAVRVG